jgi:hypothetical protein
MALWPARSPAKPLAGRGWAPDEAAAIEKGAAELKVPASRLMVIRRRPAGKAKSTAVISSELDPKAAVVRWPAFQRVCFC